MNNTMGDLILVPRDVPLYVVKTILAVVAILTIFFCVIAVYRLFEKAKLNRKLLVDADQMLLIGLCTSDILLAVTSILHAVYLYVSHQPCKRVQYGIDYVFRFTILSSVLHIVALTAWRLVIIRFPFHYKNFKTTSKTLAVGATIWAASIGISALPFKNLFYIGCPIIMASDFLLIFAYFYIWRKLFYSIERRKAMMITNTVDANAKVRRRENRVTLVCFVIVISFIVWTTPPFIWILSNLDRYSLDWNFSARELSDYIMIVFLQCKALCDPLVYIYRGGIAKRLQWRRLFVRSEFQRSSSV